jgi:hypothetical protein
MEGLLADNHLGGHLPYIGRLLASLGLLPVLMQLNVRLATFPDLGIPPDIDDRSPWNLCQRDGWVLFTENRNRDGADSLQATLSDSWQVGHLPVLTLANKRRFERDPVYATEVAKHLADSLFGVVCGEFRDRSRIWVPLYGSG